MKCLIRRNKISHRLFKKKKNKFLIKITNSNFKRLVQLQRKGQLYKNEKVNKLETEKKNKNKKRKILSNVKWIVRGGECIRNMKKLK